VWGGGGHKSFWSFCGGGVQVLLLLEGGHVDIEREVWNAGPPNNKGAFIIHDWGWAKKGVGHEVVLTDKVEAPKNIGSEGVGSSYFIIVGKIWHVPIIATAGSKQGTSKFNSW
jgi:hypothetical protein